MKPTLVEAFAPRGFDCRGGSGTFTLRRRISANHIVELELLPPVSVRAGGGQYPIGDTTNWERIVANVAVIVDELERTFVQEVEAAVSGAPEWFEPASTRNTCASRCCGQKPPLNLSVPNAS